MIGKITLALFSVILFAAELWAEEFKIPLKPADIVKKAKDLPAGITASEEDKMLCFTAEQGHKNGIWETELAMSPKKMGKTVIVSVEYKIELPEDRTGVMPPFVFECGGKKLHVRKGGSGDGEQEWSVGKTRLRLPFKGKVPFAVRFRRGEGKLLIRSITADNGKKAEPEEKKEK